MYASKLRPRILHIDILMKILVNLNSLKFIPIAFAPQTTHNVRESIVIDRTILLEVYD